MNQTSKKVITRFAPSPTGELHIGGARTALFAYLFAKHNKGEFLLRIEDTDRTRFVEGATERIIESLNWLGIVPDNLENIIYQSKRLDIYHKYAEQLIKQGDAYICTCSEEELQKDREEQIKKGQAPKYSGRCRDQVESRKSKVKSQGKHVVRMKMPKEEKIVVNDLIRGKVEFDAGLIDDQIILKSDGFPTYHLASVIDDHEMQVSYVIRAEEWLPSTPKHLVLYKMLGFEPPKFAHLSMILGNDKAKLSKRHGATSVLEYRQLGYLPEALVNFIAFLGWSPKTTEEEFSLADLVDRFTLESVNKAAAVFDLDKLNDINSGKIKNKISNIKNKDEYTTIFTEFGVEAVSSGEVELVGRGGYKTLKEASEYLLKLRAGVNYNPELLIFKKSDQEKTLKGLVEALKKLSSINEHSGAKDVAGDQSERSGGNNMPRWDTAGLQSALESVAVNNNLSNGDVFWPVRVALSGEEKSPSPVELLVALGKEESIRRIEVASKLVS